jgi:chemotaxis response regulator CheB
LKRVRILVAEVPRLLRDIIEDSIQSQPDMEIVPRDDMSDLEITVKQCQADVVIIGDPPVAWGARPGPLLLANPDLKVVVITEDGRRAQLLELRRRAIVEMSPRGLVEAIRAAMNANAR